MVSYVDRPGLNGFNGHASLYEASQASHLTCLKCGKSMLMDSLFCRHCGTKRGEAPPQANFEPSYPLASNRGAPGALPTSSLPLEGTGSKALPLPVPALPMTTVLGDERHYDPNRSLPITNVLGSDLPGAERSLAPSSQPRELGELGALSGLGLGGLGGLGAPAPSSRIDAEANYSFPTAGSFVAEAFREGVPSYSSRHPPRPEGLLEREREIHERGFGGATNGFNSYPPPGRGDTYSGGTMSYGPPPGVPGVQPCGGYPYGDGAPLYPARMPPPVQCYGGLGDSHFDPGFGRGGLGLGAGLGGLGGGLVAPPLAQPGVGPSMFSIPPTGSFVADAQMLGSPSPSLVTGFAGSSAFEEKGAARSTASKSVQVSPDSPTAAMAASGAASEATAKPSAPRPVGKSKKKTNRLLSYCH